MCPSSKVLTLAHFKGCQSYVYNPASSLLMLGLSPILKDIVRVDILLGTLGSIRALLVTAATAVSSWPALMPPPGYLL